MDSEILGQNLLFFSVEEKNDLFKKERVKFCNL